MKTIDTNPPMLVQAPVSLPDLKPAPRLIVLVPEFETDAAIVARKIQGAAKALESRVQLISLSRDALHEPGIRRRLATLAALVEDSTIFVESKVELGSDWLHAVTTNWREGDVIVCFAEPGSASLHQVLQSRLNAAVYVLSGIQMRKENPRTKWVSSLLAWTGSIALIAGFFWLQATLLQPGGTWLQTLLLYGSLPAEAGSLWLWNNLFNQ